MYAIVGGFIVGDLVTGTIKAFKEKKFNSSTMREGLYHKCGSILTMCFGAGVDYAQSFIDLGLKIPIAEMICTYIILMEIGSIIENLGKINPEIVPSKLQKYFSKLGGM